MAIGFFGLTRLGHFLSYAFCHDKFLLTWVRFFRHTHLVHIYYVPSVIVDFFLCGSGFPNSHASGTCCLVPPAMVGFFLYGSDFFNTRLVHILFCASYHDGFLLTKVRFSRLICLRYILSYTSHRTGFFLRALDFFDTRTSGTFCHVSPAVASFFYIDQVFLTCISGTFCLVSPGMIDFFLYGSDFPNICASSTFYLIPLVMACFFKSSFSNICISGTFYLVHSIMTSFFLYRSNFLDLGTSDIFCLVPPAVAIFFLRMLSFPDRCLRHILFYTSHYDRFFLT